MCGIICYLGEKPALPILLEGLRRMEYRGYDSAGVAVFDHGGVQIARAQGKLHRLESKLDGQKWPGTSGMGHTRWATHGEPSEANAHPLAGMDENVFVSHNGIIENYLSLKAKLQGKGYGFRSDTDTEVLAYLIEDLYQDDLEEAVVEALKRVEGAFGIAVMCRDEPRTVVVARRGSPLIIGLGRNEYFAASDVSALVGHTREVIYLEEDDIGVLTPDGYHVRNLDRKLDRPSARVEWDISTAEKGGFEHFMLKEIHEEPEAIRNAIRGRCIAAEGTAKLGGLESVQDRLRRMSRLIIVSCGTSYYAGLLGRYVIESCSDIAVEVDLASEFRYRKLNLKPDSVVLAISQSGETADTLAALREAKRRDILTLGLVNVVGSTIARETDAGVYNHAGPEISVASTKSFISQVAILYLLGLFIGRRQNKSLPEGQRFIRELQATPERVAQILEKASEIESLAQKYARYDNFLFMGRKWNFPVAKEGALKLKEISYIHAEAYAAGEMKHGPIALIDRNFPTVCLAPRDAVYEKMVSNIQEIRARKGPVLAVVTEGDAELADLCDDVFEIPPCGELFSPFLTTVPLQLFAYYIARERGCEIDQPRNLAKSVTVE